MLIQVIRQNRALRISFLLIGVFFLAQLTLLSLSRSFKAELEGSLQEIQSAQQQLDRLQILIEDEGRGESASKKQLAPYNEIIPFIGLLENLFELIDSRAQITIKDQEEQIFINRYADYQVSLKVEGAKELLFKALDDMHRAKYLTEVVRMNLRYALEGNVESDELEGADFTIRLFFE